MPRFARSIAHPSRAAETVSRSPFAVAVFVPVAFSVLVAGLAPIGMAEDGSTSATPVPTSDDPTSDDPASDNTIVVEMSPCQQKRTYDSLFVKSSKDLVLKGTVESGGKAFHIYLPSSRQPYTNAPRPNRKPGLFSLARFSSTYLAVDQNHDGEIEDWESYFAEFPLRIGDRMFDVEAIAADGSTVTLKSRPGPVHGAVVGAVAPDFRFTTLDGTEVDRTRYEGKVLILDCWSPG